MRAILSTWYLWPDAPQISAALQSRISESGSHTGTPNPAIVTVRCWTSFEHLACRLERLTEWLQKRSQPRPGGYWTVQIWTLKWPVSGSLVQLQSGRRRWRQGSSLWLGRTNRRWQPVADSASPLPCWRKSTPRSKRSKQSAHTRQTPSRRPVDSISARFADVAVAA